MLSRAAKLVDKDINATTWFYFSVRGSIWVSAVKKSLKPLTSHLSQTVHKNKNGMPTFPALPVILHKLVKYCQSILKVRQKVEAGTCPRLHFRFSLGLGECQQCSDTVTSPERNHHRISFLLELLSFWFNISAELSKVIGDLVVFGLLGVDLGWTGNEVTYLSLCNEQEYDL